MKKNATQNDKGAFVFNAGTIFDSNLGLFSDIAGKPESADAFWKGYIDPAFNRSHKEGLDIEAAFLETTADYQRDGFIVGFNAALQLLASSKMIIRRKKGAY